MFYFTSQTGKLINEKAYNTEIGNRTFFGILNFNIKCLQSLM